MKNILVMVIALLLFSSLVSAQVKFNLSYQEATQLYTLSVLPDVTWSAPKNMVSSAQIVLRVEADKELIPGITSLIPGLTWADNAYIEHPDGAAGYNFICIALVNGPTSQINLVAGEETALFSFKNSGNGCPGQVTLLANDDPMVQAVRVAGFNITQHFAVLGARGNAFSGFENNTVECIATSGVDEISDKIIDAVKVSPVPADEIVTIQWTQLREQQGGRQVVIFDARGREVFREKISDGQGPHSLDVPVKNWSAGMYRMQFMLADDQRSQSWNLMIIH